MSGIECVRSLRMRLPDVQCLMLTVEDDTESLFQSIVAGATGYLLKGGSMAQLFAAVRELHEGG
jgi:DNA-binding NarL/FixJ family response regulator